MLLKTVMHNLEQHTAVQENNAPYCIACSDDHQDPTENF